MIGMHMTYWESPRLNRLNASNDAQTKFVNPLKMESGLLHLEGSTSRHYANAPSPIPS